MMKYSEQFMEHIEYTFAAFCNVVIIVASERLADALSRLPEKRRTVLLMYFFLGYTDTKIGNFRLCCWAVKRAQTDKPLAPSIQYECYAVEGVSHLI